MNNEESEQPASTFGRALGYLVLVVAAVLSLAMLSLFWHVFGRLE
jgi:hypothetical protein